MHSCSCAIYESEAPALLLFQVHLWRQSPLPRSPDQGLRKRAILMGQCFYRPASKRTIMDYLSSFQGPGMAKISMFAMYHVCQCNSNIYIRPFLSLVSRLWCHEVNGPRDRLGNRQSYAEDCDAVRSHHVLMRKFDIKRCTQQTSPTSSNQSSSAKQKTE